MGQQKNNWYKFGATRCYKPHSMYAVWGNPKLIPVCRWAFVVPIQIFLYRSFLLKQAPKLGRWDSYPRNLNLSITHPLTDRGRCFCKKSKAPESCTQARISGWLQTFCGHSWRAMSSFSSEGSNHSGLSGLLACWHAFGSTLFLWDYLRIFSSSPTVHWDNFR